MNQQTFESRYGDVWRALAGWLDRAAPVPVPQQGAAPPPPRPPVVPTAEIPHLYRQVCQHLALSRARGYTPGLVEQLNRLALLGHQQLYGASVEGRRSDGGLGVIRFVTVDLPRLLRVESRVVGLAMLLFWGAVVAAGIGVWLAPELIYTLFDPSDVRNFEQMYRPGLEALGRREADTDVAMFGYYIRNNIGIALQCFAWGLVGGVGAVVPLLYNGAILGALGAHLTRVGSGPTFFSFVIGHGSFELTAIVLAGAAGMKLGWAVLAPGRHTRAEALRLAAMKAVKIVYGAVGMLVLAAFVEAFWSPRTSVPIPVKFTVGAGLWALVIGYWLLAGRRRRAAASGSR